MKQIEVESQVDFRDFSFNNTKFWIIDSFKLLKKNPFAILFIVLFQYLTMSYFVNFSVSLFTFSILLVIPLLSFFIFKSIDYKKFDFHSLKKIHKTIPVNIYIILLVFAGYELYNLFNSQIDPISFSEEKTTPINQHIFILTFSFYTSLFMTYIFTCNPFKLFVSLFPVQAELYDLKEEKQKIKYYIIETQSFYDSVFWSLFKNIMPFYFILCIFVFYTFMTNPMITFFVFSIFNTFMAAFVYFCIKDHLNLGGIHN